MNDHRLELKIDKEVTIAPPGSDVIRGMMSIVRHPDGAILLNTQNILFKSTDNGETWAELPVQLPGGLTNQARHGLGVSHQGRLFLIHQTTECEPYGQDLFVSYSDDAGLTWKASETDFRNYPPAIPNMHFHEDGNRTFIEQPDGTLMFTTTITPTQEYREKYPPDEPPGPPNYEYGGQPGDLLSDMVLRSTDGGNTWGDPSQVYPDLNPHESVLAIDPNDGNHMLIMTRIQRLGRPHEDAEKMMKETGNPQHYYKQGALFESTDGGRTFDLAKGGMTPWYGHRGSLYWSASNVVVATHHIGGSGDGRKVARISLDGGKSWIDGTKTGTPLMNQSTGFIVSPGARYTSPTIERSPSHFLTVIYREGEIEGDVYAAHWHLE